MFDPRSAIRDLFDTNTWDDSLGTDIYLTVSDDDGGDVRVPVYLGEDVDDEVVSPAVVLSLTNSNQVPADIGASNYIDDCLIDCNIYCHREPESWTMPTFMNAVVDEVESTVQGSQSSTTGVVFVECSNMRDLSGLEKSKVCRWLVEIRAYDIGT